MLLKSADWIIDLGPEGGDKGGNLVFEGTPEDLIKEKKFVHRRSSKREIIKKSRLNRRLSTIKISLFKQLHLLLQPV